MTMKNENFKLYGKKNAQNDDKGPPKRLRVTVVTVKRAYEDAECSKMPGGKQEGAD